MTAPILCVLQSRAASGFVKLVRLEPTWRWILFVQALLSGARFDLPAMTVTTMTTVTIDHIVILSLSLCSPKFCATLLFGNDQSLLHTINDNVPYDLFANDSSLHTRGKKKKYSTKKRPSREASMKYPIAVTLS